MDERQLRILRELGELGSVRAVAEALHITPSAVSQQLRLLQRPIPVPLTRKQGRVLRLTAAGEALAAAGADVHAAMARAHAVAHGLSQVPVGEVTVAAFNSAGLAFFGPLARAFPVGGPLHVSLADEDVAQADFPPLTARYDIVLAHRLDHTPRWPATVRVTPLLHEPLDVALPTDHRLTDRDTVTADDVVDEPWVTTHDGFPVIATMDAMAASAGRPIRFVHRVNEFSVAVELVRSGAGLALIPRYTQPQAPGVCLRPLAGIHARRRVDALTRPEHDARPAVRAVLDHLRDHAGQLAATSPGG